MRFLMRKIVLGVIFIVILVSLIAIARGYRFSLTQRSFNSTGIIVASSNPDGAKVYINGELEGATNSNIVVHPGEYTIEIKKDGFTSWPKHLKVKGELVLKADALLFPQSPTLSPVTSLGINTAFSSDSGDKILLVSESGDVEKDGIYLLENVRNPLSRINPLKLLVLKASFTDEIEEFSLTDIEVEFSPDEKQVLVTLVEPNIHDVTVVDTQPLTSTSETRGEIGNIYLLDSDTLSADPFVVTESVETIREAWLKERALLTEKALKAFKKPLAQVALDSFDILAFSPDETRILFTATQSASLPLVIDPPLVATNQTPEERDIELGNIYVYDAEEDKNFKVFTKDDFADLDEARRSLLWYPSSAHLVFKERDRISVFDYDGTNKRTVYSGPFENNFLTLSKDGRLFILTNFNSETGSLLDIYSVGLK